MRTLYAMSCGDIVHETFLDTWSEGAISMIFFIIYIVMFYTAFTNIFVAMIMEGYTKAEMRKKIDNDDPFPQQENLGIQRKMSLELPPVRSERPANKPARPELQQNLSRDLGSDRLSIEGKSKILFDFYSKHNRCH